MIDLKLVGILNEQIRVKNLVISHTSRYSNNYIKLHKDLEDLQKQLGNEWMKLYDPSIYGFETLIGYMVDRNMTEYNLSDPPHNSKYTYFLAHWLYGQLNTDKFITFNSLPSELKDVLMKHGIKDVTIELKKQKDYRPTVRKVGVDMYEAKIIIV